MRRDSAPTAPIGRCRLQPHGTRRDAGRIYKVRGGKEFGTFPKKDRRSYPISGLTTRSSGHTLYGPQAVVVAHPVFHTEVHGERGFSPFFDSDPHLFHRFYTDNPH